MIIFGLVIYGIIIFVTFIGEFDMKCNANNGAVDIHLRLLPIMHITKPLTVINDNINHIIQYLMTINNIIKYIINKITENPKIQFQFDVTIACNSTHSTQKICEPRFDDDIDQDSNDENEQIAEPIVDVLGNVHRKLNANKLKNINVTLSAIRKPDSMDQFEQIDDLDMNKLITLCLDTFNIKMEETNPLNYNQNFAFMNNEFRNNNFQQLCDVFSKCKLLSLQNIFDKIYKDLDISNVILFEIINFELDCNYIKESLSNFIEINSNKNYFNQNNVAIMDLYKRFENLYTNTNKTGENSNIELKYPLVQQHIVDNKVCVFILHFFIYECYRNCKITLVTKSVMYLFFSVYFRVYKSIVFCVLALSSEL